MTTKSYIQKAAQGTGIILVLTLLASLFGYLIRITLASKLTPEEYGLFYAVFIFIGFLWLFKHLGLNSALTKFIPEFLIKKRYTKIKSSIVLVFIIESCLTGLIALILLLFSKFLSVHYFKSLSAQSILWILIAYFCISIISDILVSVFLGFQKHIYYASYFFILNFSVFIFTLIFVNQLGVIAVALGYLFSSIILAVLYPFLFIKEFNFFKYKTKISSGLTKKLVMFGLPLVFAFIGGKVIGYIDTLLLTYFRSLGEVGVYNVILPTSLLMVSLGSSLATALFPMISELFCRGMKKELAFGLNKIFKYTFIFVIPIGFSLLSFSDFFLHFFFGSYYLSGVNPMRILIIGSILYTVATINISVINGVGKPKELTKIILIAAGINVLLNLFLIPKYGINGAAISTLFCYALILVMSSIKVSEYIPLKIPWFSWIKTFICGFFFIGIIFILKNRLNLNVWAELIIILSVSLAAYTLSLLLFNLIDFKELVHLKNVILKKKNKY